MTESESGHDDESKQARNLLELIDGFVIEDLNKLIDIEKRVILEVVDAFLNAHRIEELNKERKRLKQEYQEINRQFQARIDIRSEAEKHQLLKAETRYLDAVLGMPGHSFSDVATLANAVVEAHISYNNETSPHSDWITEYDKAVKEAKTNLARIICDVIDKFEQSVIDLKEKDENWGSTKERTRECR